MLVVGIGAIWSAPGTLPRPAYEGWSGRRPSSVAGAATLAGVGSGAKLICLLCGSLGGSTMVAAHDMEHADFQSDGGRGRVKQRTLVLIRWIAVAGQAATIAVVYFGMGQRVPIVP